MKKRSVASQLGIAALLLLTACGTTKDDSAVEASATTSTAEDAPGGAAGSCAGVEAADGPIELTDAFGREVKLDAAPERVVVLEWQQIEDVLSLCLTPVAVADAKGYSLWNTSEALPEGVDDVGTRGEPNLDALYAADPDLIIVEAYTPGDEIITTLEERDVPVLATKGADATDAVQNMLDTFELIAMALGRDERAAEVVEEFEAHLEEAKAAVADLDTKDFIYFDGWVQAGNVSIRPFGQGSLVGELGEALGLTNAWTGEVDEAYGLGQTDIEGLTEVGDATFFYTGTVDPEGDVMTEVEKNPIWKSLPAVKEDRAHAFPAGIWTFGGPRSSMQVLDAYVDLLAE